MIISLHTPKTAGLSFKKVLRDHFGNKMIEEYIDLPLQHSKIHRITSAIKSKILFNIYRNNVFQKKGFQCIHGHFLPYKFTGFDTGHIQYVTWLRNPVDRMCSHYYYWKRSYVKGKSAYLQKRVVEEDWSLEDFCLSKEMQNVYAQFMWGFPLDKFDFIGITEYFQEDLEYFSKVYLNKSEVQIPVSNVNIYRNTNSYELDQDLINKIKDFHSKDFEIYYRALDKRSKRKDLIKN